MWLFTLNSPGLAFIVLVLITSIGCVSVVATPPCSTDITWISIQWKQRINNLQIHRSGKENTPKFSTPSFEHKIEVGYAEQVLKVLTVNVVHFRVVKD